MHFEENCFYFLCLVDFFFGCGFKLNFSNITFPINFFFLIAQKEQYWYIIAHKKTLNFVCFVINLNFCMHKTYKIVSCLRDQTSVLMYQEKGVCS